jgi:D-alanyl-lipoteichoic acid acyltransferase DltB (MBOAT superfamily)
VVTYAGLAWIQRHHAAHARAWLVVLIPLQLLPLFYYKYADFAVNRVLGADVPALRGLLIPVGISFYTFQLVGFVLDTLAFRQPLPRFLDCLNFAGFFPQLVAGPIERRADLLPQMESFRWRWLPAGLNEGAPWVVTGLFFKCVLADNLAAYFQSGSTENPYLIWLANAIFGLRIYFDFAGYSLCALGLGRCLGVRLTLNFLSPYTATSIIEFWRRWHVTLSQWFRDYLYVPLGGGRVPWWAANIALVFVVSGIWHGAGWNFILWGGLHALYLIIARLANRLPMPSALGWGLTVLAVTAAWIGFYELDPARLAAKLRALLTPSAYGLSALREAALSQAPREWFALGLFLALAGLTLLAEWLSVRRASRPYAYLTTPRMAALLAVLTVWLAPAKNNGFIYFAF